MSLDNSLLSYFIHASAVVKLVMLMLLAASLVSWTMIFSRYKLLKQAKVRHEQFEDRFWSGANLKELYKRLHANRSELEGVDAVFYAGYNAFLHDGTHGSSDPEPAIIAAERAMRVALGREEERVQENLPLLATIGSTSPYVGLFGTVWGIMAAFHALGQVQQATIAMVAPGISEALLATAMGLFAAIPAFVAYNRYTDTSERLLNSLDAFSQEFAALLRNKAHSHA